MSLSRRFPGTKFLTLAGMANFLIVVHKSHSGEAASRSMEDGVDLARTLKEEVSNSRIDMPYVQAAFFPRRNGSGTPIVTDPATGNWLLAIGTWFHCEGYASGDEQRLLPRYLVVDAQRLARELDGFFCVVIGDARTRETLVITDIAGSCHVFARAIPPGVALCGSSLLLAALSRASPDLVGCQEFLHTGVVYEERSCFEQVRKLAPASVYCFADGLLKAHEPYWRVSALEADSLDGPAAVNALWEALYDAAQRIGRAFPRVVCDLTGGYDSRAVAAALLGARVPFTATVSGPADSADVHVSQGLAMRLKVPHCHSAPSGPIRYAEIKDALTLTDGEYDLVDYARILRTHRELMARFDISLNGSYGELARGYWWELLWPHIGANRRLDATKLARLRYGVGAWDSSLLPSSTGFELVTHLVGVIERTNVTLDDTTNTLQMDHTYLRMRMQRWQGRIASCTNQLWPCLSPFMFRRALETMLQARARLRLRSLLIRRMLAEYQPELAAYPLEHGYPALPATWRTLPRFLPALGYYGRRVKDKLAHRIGEASAAPKTIFPRLSLWQEEAVQDLLDPARMQLTQVIDRAALSDFLTRSRQAGFAHDEQWRRVLTLECGLRAIARVEARHG